MISFRKYFNLLEASIDSIEGIQKIVSDKNERPFSNIFKSGQDRIIRTIDAPEYLKELSKFGLASSDVDISKRSIDGMNINTWLKQHKDSGKLKQLIQQGKNVEYIVFSRNPIDVLRMSDHEEISSCHSIKDGGGSYSQCAWDDASNSGGIVYFLTKSDYELVKDRGDDPEIFQDRERDVEGAWPLMRVRVRRFVDMSNGDDWAIPEIRYYRRSGNVMGHDTGDYVQIVRDFIRYLQPEYSNIETSDISNMVMVGGIYSDNSPSDLLKSFFDKPVDSEYDNKNILHPIRDKIKIDMSKKYKVEELELLKMRRAILKNPFIKLDDNEMIYAQSVLLNFKDGYFDMDEIYNIIDKSKLPNQYKEYIIGNIIRNPNSNLIELLYPLIKRFMSKERLIYTIEKAYTEFMALDWNSSITHDKLYILILLLSIDPTIIQIQGGVYLNTIVTNANTISKFINNSNIREVVYALMHLRILIIEDKENIPFEIGKKLVDGALKLSYSEASDNRLNDFDYIERIQFICGSYDNINLNNRSNISDILLYAINKPMESLLSVTRTKYFYSLFNLQPYLKSIKLWLKPHNNQYEIAISHILENIQSKHKKIKFLITLSTIPDLNIYTTNETVDYIRKLTNGDPFYWIVADPASSNFSNELPTNLTDDEFLAVFYRLLFDSWNGNLVIDALSTLKRKKSDWYNRLMGLIQDRFPTMYDAAGSKDKSEFINASRKLRPLTNTQLLTYL